MPSNFRFMVTTLLLAGAAWFLLPRNRREIVPARENFVNFPIRMGTWVGSNVDIAPGDRETLGPEDFLLRDYHDAAADDDSEVGLFMAYFPSQRLGDTIHSPQNCLLGAGWQPVHFGRIEIAGPGRAPLLVNRYVIAKGNRQGLVLYWFWAHGRSVTSEYWAKFYLVQDSLHLHRSDGSLIRVSTELRQNESAADAQRRLLSFLKTALPVMGAYIPR